MHVLCTWKERNNKTKNFLTKLVRIVTIISVRIFERSKYQRKEAGITKYKIVIQLN